ncbi:hypothetical protein EKN06_00260 [Croceicoccus ponticola]|uniref:LPXTG cell wall anchor domain-containing protein n=1 Tax=Croceicoccus ponticola TaxID=2217664 RepID=A0A437GZB9_9SPHN|nr:hypothetical protein [Croceicoccus ponticola]RVQ68704.1 hypothetical protein EKN06_00260 [Croceicoccus ponticola]
MTRTQLNFRPAGSAIAAALAIVATPSMAQDVAADLADSIQSEIIVPTITSSNTPSGQADLAEAGDPALASTTAASQGTSSPAGSSAVGNVAAIEQSSSFAANPTSNRESAANTTPVRIADFEQAARSADVVVIDNAESAEGAAVLATAESARSRPVTTGQEDSESGASMTMAGGALALGLGFAGLLLAGASRRRRRPLANEPAAAGKVKPVSHRDGDGYVTSPVRTASKPAFAVSASNPAAAYSSKWDSTTFVNASPLLGALPNGAPPRTPDGRKALIDRLVRARPDHANPFRSTGARRRRARLIVQSLTQRMADQPQIDFRRVYESFGRRRTVTS